MAARSDSQPWYEKAAGKRVRKALKEKKPEAKASGRRPELQPAPQKTAGSSEEGGKKQLAKGRLLHRQPLFSPETIPAGSRQIIEHFDQLVAGVRSMTARQQEELPGLIKLLSRELTSDRASRRKGYMNEKSVVSAYISYFMWWNLVRLTRLFANLPSDAFRLADGDVILDIGSGPLTVPIALWLSRPELRRKALTVYCMDTSQNALSAGEELFLALLARTACKDSATAADDAAATAGGHAWKIVRVRGALGEKVVIREKAALITCANVFNEIIQDADMPTDYLAKKYSQELAAYARAGDSSILLIEPGEPKSARFISLMRDALMRRDYQPLAPCPHSQTCPMAGRHIDKYGKLSGKWCNFAFATGDAPLSLRKLSEKAGLPKERAALSFLLCASGSASKQLTELEKAAWKKTALSARITSDPIRLPEKAATGYYACSEKGLLLLLDRKHTEPRSGDLVSVTLPRSEGAVDKKSGALFADLLLVD